jgi:hypothetical protein
MQTSPEAWGGGGVGPGGAPLPMRKRSLTEDFNEVSPEQGQYLQMARDAFYTAPSIQPTLPDSPRVTPAQYLREEIVGRARKRGAELSPEAIEAALGNIFNHMTGQKAGDPLTVELSQYALRRLKGESPVGDAPTKAFAGQTLSQRADRRRDGFQDGRFITSPGLDTQLEALRAYTLLGAMEDSPDLQLPMFNLSGNINSVVALPYAVGNPMNWGTSDPTVDAGAGIRHLIGLRNGYSFVDPVGARRSEAEYWARLGDKAKAQEGQYKSSAEGGYYWPYSFMSDAGMAHQGETDWANALTAVDKKKDMVLSDMNMWGGEEGKRLMHLGNQLNREVPIVPEGATPEETRQARELFRQLTNQTENRMIDEYPLYQEAWNKAMPGTAMDVKEYSFPSPAWNTVANAPKYSVDLPTILSFGSAAPGIIRKSGIRGLASLYAADAVLDQATMEQPYAMTLHSANNDGDLSNYFKPFPQSNVSDDPGRPGDSTYRADFGQFKEKQRDSIRKLLEYQQRHHPLDKLQMEPRKAGF